MIPTMKKIIAISLSAFFLSSVQSLSQDFRMPKLFVEGKRIVNCGDVIQGDTVRVNYTIRNEGDAPLVINGVGKSCNCTAATLSNKTVDVGGHTTLTVTVDTQNKIGLTYIDVILSANTEQQEHAFKLIMNCVKCQDQEEIR